MYRELQQFIVLSSRPASPKRRPYWASPIGAVQEPAAAGGSPWLAIGRARLRAASADRRGPQRLRSCPQGSMPRCARWSSRPAPWARGGRRRVRIGASPSWSTACIPDLVERIGQAEADLEISVHVELETELLRLLAQGELDIALSNTELGPTDHHVAARFPLSLSMSSSPGGPTLPYPRAT